MQGRDTGSPSAAVGIPRSRKVLALLVLVLIVAAIFKGSASASFGPEVYLVVSRSFCAPTGDGHVRFHLAFANAGDRAGPVAAVPVLHTTDAELHGAALAEISDEIPAGETRYRQATASAAVAPRDLAGCDVVVGGRDLRIRVVP